MTQNSHSESSFYSTSVTVRIIEQQQQQSTYFKRKAIILPRALNSLYISQFKYATINLCDVEQ